MIIYSVKLKTRQARNRERTEKYIIFVLLNLIFMNTKYYNGSVLFPPKAKLSSLRRLYFIGNSLSASQSTAAD